MPVPVLGEEQRWWLIWMPTVNLEAVKSLPMHKTEWHPWYVVPAQRCRPDMIPDAKEFSAPEPRSQSRY